MVGARIGQGSAVEVFEDGVGVLKLYRAGIGPERARHEASVLRLLQHAGLNVPVPGDVVELDGRWGLQMSRMPGVSLQLDGDGAAQMALVQDQLHQCRPTGLPKLKDRLAERIGRVGSLSDAEKLGLIARLETLPDGERLCHGDFHPGNILVHGGQFAIIDWLDATLGPPEADIARSYVLLLYHAPGFAKAYLDATHSRLRIIDWLPVVAAARLTEDVPAERDWLLHLARQA